MNPDDNKTETPVSNTDENQSYSVPVNRVEKPAASAAAPEPTSADTTPEPSSLAVPQASRPGTQPGLSKKKGKKKLLTALLVLLVLLCAGAAVAMKLHKSKPPVSASKGSSEVAQLRLGSTQFPFNGFYPDSTFVYGAAFTVNLQMYEGLVSFRDANKIVPELAESWTNPDASTWVFKLKSGVKFQTGKLMTAADVKRSIEFAIASDGVPSLFKDTIQTVTVVDDSHVSIKTKTPDAILLNKLPYLFIVSQDKIGDALAGTGAYMLDPSVKTSAKDLAMVPFDDYHGGKPSVRHVVFSAYDDEKALLQAVKDGKIDLTDFILKLGKNLEDVPSYTKGSYDIGSIGYVGINALDKKSPLSNVKVRQALSLSISAATVIEKTNRNALVPSQFTTQNNVGFNTNLTPVKRDVTGSKTLLTQAGFPKGVTLKFTYFDNPENKLMFATIRDQAAEAGITITADAVTDADAYFTNIDAGKSQLYYQAVNSVILDSYDIFAFNFQSKNYANPTLDKLLADSSATVDVAKRKQIMQDASKFLMDDAAGIPLFNEIALYYVKDNLNYKIDPVGFAFGGYIRTITAK